MQGVQVLRDQTKRVEKIMRRFGRDRVVVGIPAADNQRGLEPNERGEIGNAALAYIQETGTRRIPRRPFLVPGVKSAEQEIAKILRHGAQRALGGDAQAVDVALERVALKGQAAAKNALQKGEDWPPLAPATIAARKRQGFEGERPLIRTGQLLNSIQAVRRRASDGTT